MCGIFGVVGVQSEIDSFDLVSRASHLLSHRGPDDSGIKRVCNSCFAHLRLSILGPTETAAQQPVERDGALLVFNGEIYNFRELAASLACEGVQSTGNSDTEILFLCLGHWGVSKTLSSLDGMFAFAYRDAKDGTVYLARDPVGEKPLYWAEGYQKVWFSSEIKAILSTNEVSSEPNLARLDDFLFTSKVNGEQTMFRDIREVEPGSCLVLKHGDSKREIMRYWQVEDFGNVSSLIARGDLTKTFSDILSNAITSRRVSDVPIGILLSGGIDSNTVAEQTLASCPADKLKLFFADNNDPRVSERVDVDLFVDHLRQHYPAAELDFFTIKLDQHDYFKSLWELTWFYDEPVQFPLTPQLSALCRKASDMNVKVLLSGEGADEILYGYDRFSRTRQLVSEGDGGQESMLQHLYFGGGMHSIDVVRELTGEVSEGPRATASWQWLESNIDRWDFDTLQMIFSQRFRLQTLLQRQDRAGMSSSVEVRAPFVAHQLVKWTNGLSIEEKRDAITNESKRILRRVMTPRLPERILRKKKQGSPADIMLWLNSERSKVAVESLILATDGFSNSYLDGHAIRRLVSDHYKETFRYTTLVWRLVCLELWHRVFRCGERTMPESRNLQFLFDDNM